MNIRERTFNRWFDTMSNQEQGFSNAATRMNRAVRQEAFAQAHELFEQERTEGYRGTFLQWLLDNREQVLAFILKLIDLFSK